VLYNWGLSNSILVSEVTLGMIGHTQRSVVYSHLSYTRLQVTHKNPKAKPIPHNTAQILNPHRCSNPFCKDRALLLAQRQKPWNLHFPKIPNTASEEQNPNPPVLADLFFMSEDFLFKYTVGIRDGRYTGKSVLSKGCSESDQHQAVLVPSVRLNLWDSHMLAVKNREIRAQMAVESARETDNVMTL